MSLFDTGIRPLVDEYLNNKAKEVRDYGDYWSASSAGYCMRKNIFDRLKVPHVKEDARKQRVFEVGHIFHEWMQRITKDAVVSIAQEVELQDEKLMIRGHFDDLVLIPDDLEFTNHTHVWRGLTISRCDICKYIMQPDLKILKPDGNTSLTYHSVLYDYKTQNSRAFTWQKDKPISYFHRLQLGTYMYMIRKLAKEELERRHVV